MGLPGRPNGNPDAIRECAQSWSQLSSFLSTMDGTLSSIVSWLTSDCNWKGPAASEFAEFWGQYEKNIPKVSDQCAQVSSQLNTIANEIQSAQEKYDHMVEMIAATTAVGIGLSFFSFGISDLVGAAADGAEVGAVGALVAEIAETLDGIADLLSGIFGTLLDYATALLPDFVLDSEALGSATTMVSGVVDGILESPEIMWLRSAGWMPTLARAILINAGLEFGGGMGITLVKNIGDPGNILNAEAQWLDKNAESDAVQSVVWGGVMFGAEFGGPVLAKALFDDPAVKKLGGLISLKGLTELGIGVGAGALANGLVIPTITGGSLTSPLAYLEGGAFGGMVGEAQEIGLTAGKKLASGSLDYLRTAASDLLDSYGLNSAGLQIVKEDVASSVSSALAAAGQHPIVTMVAIEGTAAITFDFVEVKGQVYMIGSVSPYKAPAVAPQILNAARRAA